MIAAMNNCSDYWHCFKALLVVKLNNNTFFLLLFKLFVRTTKIKGKINKNKKIKKKKKQ
jgi:hypothetical protein